MADYRYERLTALDNSFLVFESPDTPMQVASTAIFEAGPLLSPAGGVDIERITAYVASRLHLIPRYRERLAYIPIEGHPVWVDDARFNLHYHIRHTSLPKPGDERQLKRMSARIMSQQLDRGKPLWETWIVEGLEGGRLAMISKVHHCMIDGVSGVDLLTILLSPTPAVAVADPVRWIPRPAPGAAALLRDEVMARLQAPLDAVTRLIRQPRRTLAAVADSLQAMAEAAAAGMRLASPTPFNQPIGPHRRFDWAEIDLAEVRAIKARLGGTVNDVVLTVVAGAVRHFLLRRGVEPRAIQFRAFVPVSTRGPKDHNGQGNHVAAWFVDLPIAEADAVKRLAKVRQATARAKHSKQARGAELLTEVVEWTGSTVLTVGSRLASRGSPFNLVVTNVPGPQVPLYLLGARMTEVYPMVPLFVNLGLGIALFSYAGKIFWGFNADWDVVPDLHDFVGAVQEAFAELRRLAAEPNTSPSENRRRLRRNGRAPRGRGNRRAHTSNLTAEDEAILH